MFFVARYLFVSLFMKVKTEDAKCTVFNQYVDARALIIRDEIIVDSSQFTRLIIGDKNKVAKNQTIALSYKSEDDLDNDYELLSNKSTIDCLNDISCINSDINDLIKKNNQYGKYNQKIQQLILNKEKIIENKYNYQPEISKTTRPYFQEIKSDYNGIFSCFVDGFEHDLYTSMNLFDINFDTYNRNRDVGKNILGKIVIGKKCIILCDKSIELRDSFDLKFGTSNNEVKCRLLKTTDNKSIFEAEISDSLVDLRLENIKIKTGSYKGFKLPRSAIHDENGIKGVFILDRKILNFKEIDIKYENDDFVICECNETKENQLQENDAVVVSGRNLYDGKIIMH